MRVLSKCQLFILYTTTLCLYWWDSISIIAIHGFSGHRKASWIYRDKITGIPTLWLGDLLPESVPTARIMTYGYDSKVTNARYLTQRTLYSRSQTLLAALEEARRSPEARQRPLIFIAHSLGGILLKSALIFASRDKSPFKDLYLSTAGIFFFGTPHDGDSASTWIEVVKNIISISMNINTIKRTLNSDLAWLQHQLEQYKTLSDEFPIYCAFESNKVDDMCNELNNRIPVS